MSNFSKNVQKRMITMDEIDRSNQSFNTGAVQHNLNLVPAHSPHEPFRIDTAHASSYHNKWIMVDFIFYSNRTLSESSSSPKLTLLANYQLPAIEECARVGPIPNRHLGSDHYMTAARFAID